MVNTPTTVVAQWRLSGVEALRVEVLRVEVLGVEAGHLSTVQTEDFKPTPLYEGQPCPPGRAHSLAQSH